MACFHARLGEAKWLRHTAVTRKRQLKCFVPTANLAAEYLNSELEDGDATDLILALRSLSKASGGVQEVARRAEINAHTLYRT